MSEGQHIGLHQAPPALDGPAMRVEDVTNVKPKVSPTTRKRERSRETPQDGDTVEEDTQGSLAQKTALIARLQKELLEERDRLAEAKADMAQFADELAAAHGYLAIADSTIEARRQQVEEYRAALLAARDNMEKCDVEVSRLQKLLVQEQRQLADALRDYSALKGDLRALEVQLKATTVQLGQLRAQNAELALKAQEAAAERDEAALALQIATEMLAGKDARELTAQLDEEQAALETNVAERGMLVRVALDKDAEKEQLSMDVATAQTCVNEMKQTELQLRARLVASMAANTAATAQLDKAQERASELSLIINELNFKNAAEREMRMGAEEAVKQLGEFFKVQEQEQEQQKKQQQSWFAWCMPCW